MPLNKLREIVKEIQYKKKMTVEQVAESIGYSRVHLTKEMKKGENGPLLKLLLDKHGDILQNVSREEMKEQPHPESPLSNITIDRFIESHLKLIAATEEQAKALRIRAEAEKITAQNHSNLIKNNTDMVDMVKPIAHVPSESWKGEPAIERVVRELHDQNRQGKIKTEDQIRAVLNRFFVQTQNNA